MRGLVFSLCIFFVAEAASSASVFFTAKAASSGSVCPPRPKPLPLSELSPSLVEAGEAWAQELKSAADQAGIPSFQWQANYRDLIISSGASGLASISPQVEATPETLYRIGSVSKLYSTVILYKVLFPVSFYACRSEADTPLRSSTSTTPSSLPNKEKLGLMTSW